MEITKKVIKIILTVTNAIFTLVGIAYLVVGSHMCASRSLTNYAGIFNATETLRSMNLILIFTGCFVLLLAALGIAGCWLEHGMIMNVYLVLLVVTLVPFVVILILTITKDKQVDSYVIVRIKDRLMIHYGRLVTDGSDDSVAFTDGIDKFQREQKCCGWLGSDTGQAMFIATPWYQHQVNRSGANPQLYPDSCCTERVVTRPETKDACVRPADANAARIAGFLHANECSGQLSALNSRYTRLIIGSTLFGMAVLSAAVALGWLFLTGESK